MFLIFAYDDRTVRSFRGTACQSYDKVKINLAPTYNDNRAKIALWNDPLVYISHCQQSTSNGINDVSVKYNQNTF